VGVSDKIGFDRSSSASRRMFMQDQEFLVLLDQRITEIARAVLDEALSNGVATGDIPNDASCGLRDQLALIKAKEHVTVREAALLLSCSESHVRKLVTKARKGKTLRPIPFVDMEGLTVFPRETLMEWASPTSHLQIVKNEAA
jgi:hypothetical protein